MSLFTTASTTKITCAVCAQSKNYDQTVGIYVGADLIDHDVCGPCHRTIKHLSTTNPWRFDALPTLEEAVA
jgi:hypothetical protein